MAEKCWCDEALELEESPTGEHDLVSDIWFCPVHGENWRLSQEQVIALVAAVRATMKISVGDERQTYDQILAAQKLGETALAALPKGDGCG